jgi:hypothetical protein
MTRSMAGCSRFLTLTQWRIGRRDTAGLAWRPSIKPHGRPALSHGGPRHLSGYATLLSGSQRLPSYLPLGLPSRPPLP